MDARRKYLAGWTPVSNAFLARRDLKPLDKMLLIWARSKTPSWLVSVEQASLNLGVDVKTARAAIRRLTEQGWFGEYKAVTDPSTGLIKHGGRSLLRRDEIADSAGQVHPTKNGRQAPNSENTTSSQVTSTREKTEGGPEQGKDDVSAGRVHPTSFPGYVRPSVNETSSSNETPSTLNTTSKSETPRANDLQLKWQVDRAWKHEIPLCVDCRMHLTQTGKNWPEVVPEVTKTWFEAFHARGHKRKVSQ